MVVILFILLIDLIFVVGFLAWVTLYVYPFFFGAPYVRSSDARTKTIIKLLKPKRGEKIVDLGSGDGKLLFEIAKTCAAAYGYEINPVLVFRTKRKIKKMRLERDVFVKRGNFFKEDLSKFDAVVVYGISYLMPKLERKLIEELKPGTRVVSNYFEFPNWKPIARENNIFVYKKT